LLSGAEAPGFGVIVTVDQGIPHQQNLANRNIALLILCTPRNGLRDLQQFFPAALIAVSTIQPGDIVRVR
jgi:hypothetical protein